MGIMEQQLVAALSSVRCCFARRSTIRAAGCVGEYADIHEESDLRFPSAWVLELPSRVDVEAFRPRYSGNPCSRF
eukprot:6396708-Prorocentrum_lima.AAC.1